MAGPRGANALKNTRTGDLAPLAELANNLWWSWNADAAALFALLDPRRWRETEHNPVAVLRTLPARRLRQLATDRGFRKQLRLVHQQFRSYMRRPTWYGGKYGRSVRSKIAYLCMEYALHESLPIYAGGLGVLAGDHVKAASDLGLPLVGVGIFWRNGYVRQHVGRKGTQHDWFVDLCARDMPMREVTNRAGRSLRLRIPLGRSTLVTRAWRLDVGRVPLFLLDTDIPENASQHRRLSHRLYCNDREERLCQEILLGIGGLRLLQALRIPVAVYHLNEGHAAFASLDRVTQLVALEKHSLRQAVRIVASTGVFTTHTPVPAGNEAFDPALIEKYLHAHRRKLKTDSRTFLALGRVDPDSESEPYSMTPLALRLSNYRNGVSALHGAVARKMWQNVWPGRTIDRTPIGSITNGIHLRTWMHPKMGDLLDAYLPADWDEKQDQARTWAAVKKIPDAALWELHQQLRQDLIDFVRDRMRAQLRRMRAPAKQIRQVDSILDHGALTIGFARRFAPYKRAALIFTDPNRLARILNHSTRPVQILFAGKAHPGDSGGGDIIARIERFARSPRFRRRVVLIEDYTMEVARYLVSGVDLWLNTPRRPQEASGTSGMKPTLHGGLNLSILDGWWPEAFDGRNGWTIGPARDHRGTQADDRRDAAGLYRTLERDVVPLFYDRTRSGLPRKWIARMKHSLATIPSAFNADRMVKEYFRKYYLPALRTARRLGL
ncbi:MAG: alpha-glucan family phosphorylase [Phycisphaerales bacterium]|nr:MAG: alpha-glucan family phosphorylase [Phycisphaerales bacterium]